MEILKREGRPLHYKDLTEKATARKLLTFVGRTPEVTMQTQLTAAVKKAPGNPFVRTKPGIFGLLRYPERPADEPEVAEPAKVSKAAAAAEAREAKAKDGDAPARGGRKARGGAAAADGEKGTRRGRRGGRGRGRGGAAAAATEATETEADTDKVIAAEDEAAETSRPSRAAHGASDGAEASESASTAARADADDADGGDDGDDDEGEGEGAEAGASTEGEGAAGDRSRRRRRRRRRGRRGGVEGEAFEGTPRPALPPSDVSASESASEPTPAGDNPFAGDEAPAADGQAGTAASGPTSEQPRRAMAPLDAALEILRGQAPGRGVHVRQIADMAVRRRLVHGESNEAWRVLRAALATEPKERLRTGMRPRVRPAGSGLYTLARRPSDVDLERAEYVFGEARRALRERTLAALERRLAELAGGPFEALCRVVLQREGFGPATFVKKVETTIYLEALRGRVARSSRCLIALKPGGGVAGRRTVGELRAGVRAKNYDEGVLLTAARLGEDALAEWKQAGAPVEIADGPGLADTCIRHGLGVISAQVPVDFVDADFFSELVEG